MNNEKSKKILYKIAGECIYISVNAFKQLKAGDFKVKSCEEKFNLDLGLKTDNRSLIFTGKIDRTDSCGDYIRVIDYKSGNRKLEISKIAAGLTLQLPLYLMYACEGKRPAGAYYLKCDDKIIEKDNAKADEEDIDEKSKDHRLNGITNNDPIVLKITDRELYNNQYGNSKVANLKLKKGSTFQEIQYTANSLVLSENDFNILFSFIKHKIIECFKSIKEGDIRKMPYEGNCRFCDYKDICTFEEEGGNELKLEKISLEDLLAKEVKEI